MWCDGLIPESETLEDGCISIGGTAWIMGLRNAKWRFVIKFPAKIKSLGLDNWQELIPKDDLHGWLRINIDELWVEINLAACV